MYYLEVSESKNQRDDCWLVIFVILWGSSVVNVASPFFPHNSISTFQAQFNASTLVCKPDWKHEAKSKKNQGICRCNKLKQIWKVLGYAGIAQSYTGNVSMITSVLVCFLQIDGVLPYAYSLFPWPSLQHGVNPSDPIRSRSLLCLPEGPGQTVKSGEVTGVYLSHTMMHVDGFVEYRVMEMGNRD